MPVGVEIIQSASSRIIQVLVKAGRLSSFQMERGIRLMLAPRSAKAKHSFTLKDKRKPEHEVEDGINIYDLVILGLRHSGAGEMELGKLDA
ncbi:hypothetical protein Tco_0539622 [Tanacetum coccineum]